MKTGRFRHRTTRNNRQDGYLLIVLMIMVTLIAIAAVATAPSIATQIKRDREEELVHRGAQYARAVKKFYKKFGRYPTTIDQLVNTNNIRFLRQKYKDPITGKDFKILHVGEVVLTASGASGTTSNTGPGSGSSPQVNPNGPLFSGPPSGTNPTSPTIGGSGGTGAGSSSSTGSDLNPKPLGGTGPTFGGGPIIGVTSQSEKVSLMEFNDKNHYNQWYFVYDPTYDRGALITGPWVPPKAGVGGNVGTPAGNLGPGGGGGTNNSNSPTIGPMGGGPNSGGFNGGGSPFGGTLTSPSSNNSTGTTTSPQP